MARILQKQAASIRESGQKFGVQAVTSSEVPFSDRSSDRFKKFIQKLHDVRKPAQPDRLILIGRYLDRHLAETQKIVDELDATQRQPVHLRQSAWADKRTQAIAKRTELALLRKEALDEIDRTQAKLTAAGLTQAASAWTQKRNAIERRFQDLDGHLAGLESASSDQRAERLTRIQATWAEEINMFSTILFLLAKIRPALKM